MVRMIEVLIHFVAVVLLEVALQASRLVAALRHVRIPPRLTQEYDGQRPYRPKYNRLAVHLCLVG